MHLGLYMQAPHVIGIPQQSMFLISMVNKSGQETDKHKIPRYAIDDPITSTDY